MSDRPVQTMPKGNLAEICGKFSIPKPEKESWKLLNTYPGVPTNNDYIILDTDYETFYAGYSCKDIPVLGFKMETGWAMTRGSLNPMQNLL